MKNHWLIVLGICLIFVFFGLRRQEVFTNVKKSITKRAFNGIIDEVKIGERDVPYFIINNDSFSLGTYGHSLNGHIKNGDSIYKNSGSSIVFVLRLIEQDTIRIDLLEKE